MTLSDLNNYTRQKIVEYLHYNKMSLNAFANDVGVYQPNLHVFLNGKSLSIKSIEKIWSYFESRGIK